MKIVSRRLSVVARFTLPGSLAQRELENGDAGLENVIVDQSCCDCECSCFYCKITSEVVGLVLCNALMAVPVAFLVIHIFVRAFTCQRLGTVLPHVDEGGK